VGNQEMAIYLKALDSYWDLMWTRDKTHVAATAAVADDNNIIEFI
jgi:hypothetical protein